MKFHNVEITTVVEGFWADREGIEVDDEIVEVNGTMFGGLEAADQLKLLKQRRPLTIKFKRPIVKDSYYTVSLDADKVGMGFKGNRVSTVTKNGWAQNVGILTSDEIVEVNSTPFSQLKEAEKVALFKQPRPIGLKMKRPAMTIKAQIEAGQSTTLPGNALAKIPKALLSENNSVGPKTEILSPEPTPIVGEKHAPPVIESRAVNAGSGWFSCCAAGNTTGEMEVMEPMR